MYMGDGITDGLGPEVTNGLFPETENLPTEGSSLATVVAALSKPNVRAVALLPFSDPVEIRKVYGNHSFQGPDGAFYDFINATHIRLEMGDQQQRYPIDIADALAYLR